MMEGETLVFRRNVNIFNIRTKKKKLYIKAGCNYEPSSKKTDKVYLNDNNFIQSLVKYIGQTITIFTVSGGQSGAGFTGVLLDVKTNYIKILSQVASGPDCPLGNCCEINKNEGTTTLKDDCGVSLGAITNIPLDKISAFVHNTI